MPPADGFSAEKRPRQRLPSTTLRVVPLPGKPGRIGRGGSLSTLLPDVGCQCTRALPIIRPSSSADTSITLPSARSPASSFRAIGSISSFWMTRFSGRAP